MEKEAPPRPSTGSDPRLIALLRSAAAEVGRSASRPEPESRYVWARVVRGLARLAMPRLRR